MLNLGIVFTLASASVLPRSVQQYSVFVTCLSVRDKCTRSADSQVCSPGQKSTAESYSRMLSLILGYYGLEHAQTLLDLPTDVYWSADGHCDPSFVAEGLLTASSFGCVLKQGQQ